MDQIARALIDRLRLEPHPEGGYYREIYRSSAIVQPDDDRGSRSAVTTIYYLLCAGQHSRWHRVRSDELWQFYEGEPLDLIVASPSLDRIDRITLDQANPIYPVPPDWWQAARPRGAYALAGCTVAPGFEFMDFSLIRNDVAAARKIEELYLDLVPLI